MDVSRAQQGKWHDYGRRRECHPYAGTLTRVAGIGGRIELPRPVEVISYLSNDRDEFRNKPFTIGDKLFLQHLVMAQIDRLARRLGQYQSSHIALPLGSYKYGYYYQRAKGEEGFAWQIYDGQDYYNMRLGEWAPFIGIFGNFGFEVGHDRTEGRYSKNIILADSRPVHSTAYGKEWVRIDLGLASCPFNEKEFVDAVAGRPAEIMAALGQDNLRLFQLYADYISQKLDPLDVAYFCQLVYQARLEIARSLVG